MATRFVRRSEQLDRLSTLSNEPTASVARIAREKAYVRKRGETEANDRSLFEIMVRDTEIFRLVTSKRRHFIVDSIALVVGLARHLGICGPVLDVGCHAGFVADVASHLLENQFTGIDPVASAIAYGKERVVDAKRVSLLSGRIPWQTDHRFAMIAAIDSMPRAPGETALFLRGIGDLLETGGLAIVVSAHLVDADHRALRHQLKNARLGFGFADIVGGFGGAPNEFVAEGTLILVKDGQGELPSRMRSLMESDWHHFKSYANSPTTPASEKTQAFERAHRGAIQATQ